MIKIILLFCFFIFTSANANSIAKYEIAGAKLNISILEIMSEDQVLENVLRRDERDE